VTASNPPAQQTAGCVSSEGSQSGSWLPLGCRLPYFDAFVVAGQPRKRLLPRRGRDPWAHPGGPGRQLPGAARRRRGGWGVAPAAIRSEARHHRRTLCDLTATHRRQLDGEVELVGVVMEAEPTLTVSREGRRARPALAVCGVAAPTAAVRPEGFERSPRLTAPGATPTAYSLRWAVLNASATVPTMSRPPKSTRPGASSASPSTMAATPIAVAAAR
jgi:hypothetical protein